MTIQCFFVQVDGKGKFSRDNGPWRPMDELEPGGMFWADWYQRKGPDGHHLIVKTPGGLWHVDGFASNCTRPGDWSHYCWVRHGEAPNITVDKNGDTCGCGQSIQQGFANDAGFYHGFLRNGQLVPA
jgi:hypothetical protein